MSKKKTEESKEIRAYKVFNPDFTCRDFQFEVGKTYKHEGRVEVCASGFHACIKVGDCFNYYGFNPENKVAEVILRGEIQTHDEDSKVAAGEIEIVRELSWHEVLDLVNTGFGNTGLANSGNRNSGYYNSGDYNSGNRNSGDRNSGDRNSGDRNSGDYNSGDYNSGDYNSGDYNSGIFNTNEPKMRAFNKESEYTYTEFRNKFGYNDITLPTTAWIPSSEMTEAEKEEHQIHELLGGFLRVLSYKEAWAVAWKDASESERQWYKSLPNFDAQLFQEITGIEIEK